MDKIVVLDFGGQYTHLIVRRLRELNIYSKILPAETSKEKLSRIKGLKGIILSGGPVCISNKKAPKHDPKIFNLKKPILGICYGCQLIATDLGGRIVTRKKAEYGKTEVKVSKKSQLFKGMRGKQIFWMNHKHSVFILPEGFKKTASSQNCKFAGFENPGQGVYAVQFHPEVWHSKKGFKIFENFAFEICKAQPAYVYKDVVQRIVKEAKKTLKGKKAIIGLSGGIDSSVSAVLVHKAIGKNLTAVYIDTGLMRYDDTELVKKVFPAMGINLKVVDAKEKFFKELEGIRSPEKKRKIVGKTFVKVFEKIAREEKADYLIQGTIYSDRIESGINSHSSRIKSHHNVAGLPKKMNLQLYEPLRDLYKDEVRRIASILGMPNEITSRHVFPGPGLAVRIIGRVTPEKAAIARKASFIVEEELKKAGLYEKMWMGFAILLPVKSVGVQGDARSYQRVVVLRAVVSEDSMTANIARIPYTVLEKISSRIANEIRQVNRVVYDITNKPPATMEWE